MHTSAWHVSRENPRVKERDRSLPLSSGMGAGTSPRPTRDRCRCRVSTNSRDYGFSVFRIYRRCCGEPLGDVIPSNLWHLDQHIGTLRDQKKNARTISEHPFRTPANYTLDHRLSTGSRGNLPSPVSSAPLPACFVWVLASTCSGLHMSNTSPTEHPVDESRRHWHEAFGPGCCTN